MKKQYLYTAFIFFCISFSVSAQEKRPSLDSIIKEWETKGVPPHHLNDYNEYKTARKKVAAIKNTETQNERGSLDASQTDACYNPGFELGNFNNWQRREGITLGQGWIVPQTYYDPTHVIFNGGFNLVYNAPPTTTDLFVLNTSIYSDSITGQGYDMYSTNGWYYGIKSLKTGGGNYSVRINNDNCGSKAEKLTYSFTVNSQQPYFIYNYAIVLSDGGHQNGEQAAFISRVLDSVGNTIYLPNSPYYVNANNAIYDPTFQQSLYGYKVYYKKWTTDTINLCQFTGKTLTIVFEAIDCIYGAHFCYAYIDAKCAGNNSASIPSPVCPDGSNFTLQAPGGYTSYQWLDPQGQVISAAQTGNLQTMDMNLYVANCTSGNCTVNNGDVFTVQVTTAQGCRLTVPCTIIKPPVKIAAVSKNPTCLEGSKGNVSVNVSGGMGTGTYNYTWYANTCSGAPIGSSNSINNLPAGNYCVHVSSGFCPPTDTLITIASLPLSLQYSTVNLPLCFDTSYVIHATTPGANYNWYTNSVSIPNQTDTLQINPMNYSAVYNVTYFNQNAGCKDSVKYTITLSNDASLNAMYCPGDSVASLFAPISNPGNYQWYKNNVAVTGAVNDTLGPVPIGDISQYYVTYYAGTCRHLAKNILHVFPQNIFIPDTTTNVFTPNADGINDTYYPFYTKYAPEKIAHDAGEYSLIIYNRWGQVVFEADDYTKGWDGNDKSGMAATAGTYYWIANFSSNCAENPDKTMKKGFLQLIR